MWLTNIFAKIAGKKVASELQLKDGPMTDSKKWFQSKTVWSGIITVLIGLYAGIQASIAPQFGWNLPAIPEWVFAFLGALGIYYRATATKTIG